MDKISLFCFPYAGGSATIYNKWRKYIDSCIEIVPVELSGRGKRFNEPLYDNINDVVDDMYHILKESINGPYALFGHSMGSVIAYDLAYRISNSDLPNPEYLFLSGRKPPHIEKREKIIHTLPDEEFKNEIINMGGTEKEVFENKQLLELFLPIMRSDFRIVENYRYMEKSPLDIKIIGLYGDEEDIDYSEAKEWSIHTRKDCRIFEMKGNHFFINDSTKEIVNILNNVLKNNHTRNLYL